MTNNIVVYVGLKYQNKFCINKLWNYNNNVITGM